MAADTPRTIYLRDYLPPDFLVDTVDLRCELGEETTRVRSRLALRRNPARPAGAPLVLDGKELELESIALDGRPLAAGEYQVDAEHLTVDRVPDSFALELVTAIRPQDNTALSGLYKSSGNFCTQCEAEGFRRITYYPDRPDVMASFTTTVVADPARYPVLLSNGNLVDQGALADGRRWATWRDPFNKPAYLFALVAGDLVCAEDRFTTMSGRQVRLQVYVQQPNADKCEHALRSLQRAMRWDEQVYGREYDLDVYMIVAVDDFNFGAMENKGLNVFNSKNVLAKPETASDEDYEAIQGMIGHEYFHNWSGNRVTLRDWFQLSLKEGFTVFRDQQFTADMTSAAVKRIRDVAVLRSAQFREDAGPLAHSVRPDSYVEISNFYTVTVYNKGAELVRMLHHLLGAERFRRGTDLYFERHDGQAVTTDDFVAALQEASGVDLTQFKRWYTQAGTPLLEVGAVTDAAARTCTLTVRQSCPSTPGQPDKEPFHLPFAIGLIGSDGRELPLRLSGEPEAAAATTRVLEIRQHQEKFVFDDVTGPVVPSLLRGLTAPVKVAYDYSDDDLAFLLAHDGDPFNRWDAGQQLAIRVLGRLVDDQRADRTMRLDGRLVEAFRSTLNDARLDRRLKAQALTLPDEGYLAELSSEADPAAIHEARQFVRRQIGLALKSELTTAYWANHDGGPYTVDARAIGRRRLKNACLGYLMELDDSALRVICVEQFNHSDNMTDVVAALVALANVSCPERSQSLRAFYDKWRDDPLVVDKWFAIQATSRLPNTLNAVKALLHHQAFNIKNPNKVRALIGAFCQANPVRFHDPTGAGYAFLTEQVLALDAINGQMAARMCQPLSSWKRYEPGRREQMRAQLQRLAATPRLSKDVYEIVAKSLG
ncbi:MAG: aminopeptidase N [Deltaproteobacteria bacterium]|nr:aminopeptidase N [Deltaproteobacteria bacterium]